ncbi:MAG: hypothetical protein ACYCT2_09945, partial [Thermoplasmataceae archaeon]
LFFSCPSSSAGHCSPHTPFNMVLNIIIPLLDNLLQSIKGPVQNLLSLYLHFQVLNMIGGKYSVRDVLLILSRIKIYDLRKQEMLGEIPKRAKDLVSTLNIDLDMLSKK